MTSKPADDVQEPKVRPCDEANNNADELVAALHANFGQLVGNLDQSIGHPRDPASLVAAYENWFGQFGPNPVEIAWAFSCNREALAACRGLFETQLRDLIDNAAVD